MTRSNAVRAAIAAFTVVGWAASADAADGERSIRAIESAAPAAAAENGAFACHPTRTGTKFGTVSFQEETSSVNFAPVNNTKIRFYAKKDTCLLVQFSAEAATNASEALLVQAVLDGTTILEPGEIQLVGNDNFWRSYTVSFFLKKVPYKKGKHTIEIQWKSLVGGMVFLRDRSIKIEHE